MAQLKRVGTLDIGPEMESSKPVPMDAYMLGQSREHYLSGSVTKDAGAVLALIRLDDRLNPEIVNPGVTIRTELEAANVIQFLKMAFPVNEEEE